jgi:hypothetical protein
MFASPKNKAAAVVVLLALATIPAPLLPPLGLAAKVQTLSGISWNIAYLIAALGLHAVLYGSLGVLGAFAVGLGKNWRQRLLQVVVVPVAVVGIGLLVRSLKLGHVPLLANAVIPMAACALGVIVGLLFRQQGWLATLIALGVLGAGLLWAFFPGAAPGLSQGTEARLRRLVELAPGLPSGDARFGALLQAAFSTPVGALAQPGAVEQNRAAIVALGIAIGHERLARYVGLDRRSELVQAAMALRRGTALRDREDWVRHFCLSATLAVVENSFISDAGGLFKEQLDALTEGSGFSFGDLAADRAGVRFAGAATGSESSAMAIQERLREGFSVDDFLPPISDLPEDLTTEQFRLDYGGAGSQRYRQMANEIESRLDRCAALSRTQLRQP